jgi:hypothetical protein
MSERETESLGWRIVWEFPVIGELLQTIVLFLPVIALGAMGLLSGAGDRVILLIICVVEIAWLWALERFGRTRLVVPIVRLPWLWVFMVITGYSALVAVGVMKAPA